jgi:hypothetical protein
MAKIYRVPKYPTIFEQADGELRPFTSPEAFTGKGYRFGQEQQVSEEQLGQITRTGGLGAPIGGELIRGAGAKEVYKYVPGKGLVHIKSPQALESEFGAGAWSKIAEVDPSLIAQYRSWTPSTAYKDFGTYQPPTTDYEKLRREAEARAGVPEAKEEKKGVLTKIGEFLAKPFKPAETWEAAEARYGVPERGAELTKMDTLIAERQAAWQKSITDIEGRPMPMGIITGAQAHQQRLAAVELNALTALRNAKAGDYNRAVERAKYAAGLQYDTSQQEYKNLMAALEIAKDKADETQKAALNSLTAEIEKRKDALERENKLFDKKVDLMIKHPDANILITDSWDEITRKAGIAEKKEKRPTAESRDTEVSSYLNSKKGTDGYVAAETYQEALRKFIARGGTQTDFFASFPQETYLRQQEIDKLPAAMKPKLPGRMTASTIDQNTLAELTDDIQKGATLQQLYEAYSEISPALIQSIYYNY